MPTINAPERVTQNHVIRFFSDKLHYTYLGDLHDRENSNIMSERLQAWLSGRGYSERLSAAPLTGCSAPPMISARGCTMPISRSIPS